MEKISKKIYKTYDEYFLDVFQVCHFYVNAFLENEKKDLTYYKILENNLKNSEINVVSEKILENFNFEEKFAVYLILFKVSSSKINLKLNKIAQKLKQNVDFALALKIASLDPNKNSDKFAKKLNKLGISITDTELPTDIFNAIMCNEYLENHENLKNSKSTVLVSDLPEKLSIREEFANKIKKFLTKREIMFFNLFGPFGIGKKTFVKRAAKLSGNYVLEIDFKYLRLNYPDFMGAFENILEEASTLPENTILCAENIDVFLEMYNEEKIEQACTIAKILNLCENNFKKVFLLTKERINFRNYNPNLHMFSLECEPLSLEENVIIWKEFSKDFEKIAEVNPTEIANKFTITPGEIREAIKFAEDAFVLKDEVKLNEKEFNECIYSATNSTLSKLGQLIKEKYTWDDIVLEPKIEQMLRIACDQVKYKSEIYVDWGMQDKVLYGKGLAVLLTGPPGTGKTMAAQVISNELGLDLYRVDLSKIVSKYIGETEKNLRNIFDEAKKSNVILLFDEADVLFGKRTETKDSHDRNANLETAYLLQKMEEHPGITLLTTNLSNNIDNAFSRRLSFVIDFSTPDNDQRKIMWENIFPKNIQFEDDMDFEYLIRQFEFSGASIRSIALNSMLLAKRKGKNKIGLQEIIDSIKIERDRGSAQCYIDFREYENLANPEMAAKPQYIVRGPNPYLDNLY